MTPTLAAAVLSPALRPWVEAVVALGLGVAVVAALAAVAARFSRRATVRRTVWQSAAVALALVAALEVTGLAPAIAVTLTPQPEAGAVVAATDGAVFVMLGEVVPRAALWPAAIWGVGFLVLAGRLAVGQVMLSRLRRRLRPTEAARVEDRVRVLARRLGYTRCVRAGCLPGLSGPLVFGVWRPVLALPPCFTEAFSSEQQEAMLAHELGHLAGGDPGWQLFSDLATAALWWHPLAWWARAELRRVNEAAADEASLAVDDGPRLLALSLVALGRRLAARPLGGSFAAAGAGRPSALGRRVEALLRLDGPAPRRPRRVSLVPLALLAAALGVTAWLRPSAAANWSGAWERSLAGQLAAAVSPPADRPQVSAVVEDPPVYSGPVRRFVPHGAGSVAPPTLVRPFAPAQTAPRARAVPSGSDAPRSAAKSDEEIVAQLKLSPEQMQRFRELQAELGQEIAAMHALPSGRVERGLTINRRWRAGLQSIFTPDQYRRYQRYWGTAVGGG